MLIRVAPEHRESLVVHLADQGFPATRVGCDRLDVLFPASPPLFAAAVELDDWVARTGTEAPTLVDAETTQSHRAAGDRILAARP